MDLSVEKARSVGEDVIDEIKAENVTFMAGSIAYQAFVSLIPLLALVFLATAAVGDQQLAQTLTDYTKSAFPPRLQALISNYITGGSSGTAGAGIIGVVTLVWGTLKIFRGLDTAFSEIYDTTRKNSIVDQLKDGVVVLGAIGVALLAAAVATSVFAIFPEIPYIGLLSPLLLIVGLTIAFFPMYYLFPDVDVSYRDAVPGVIVAAVGWTLLQTLFQAYVAIAGGSGTSASDVIGAILLLLTWLYLGGVILLIGAVLNAVLAGEANLDEERAESGDDTDAESASESKFEDRRTGGDATPAASSSSALSFESDDGRADRGDAAARIEELDERERQLRDEAERLRDRRGELEQLRAELEEAELLADEGGNARGTTLEAALAENRELRRQLRWARKPAWKRTAWRLLGRRPRRGPE